MKENNSKIRKITIISLMVAIIAVVSQIAIPMPNYVPLTFQVFIIALIGYMFGIKYSFIITFIYIALGAIGFPVFASFKGGIYALFDYTGGFIWGFLVITVFCGISANKYISIILGIISVILSHILGMIWYVFISQINFFSAFIVVSLPYIFKDIILIPLAYIVANKIKKHIKEI